MKTVIPQQNPVKRTNTKGISDVGNGPPSRDIVSRPIASPGHWLCMLLPLAFASNLLQNNRCNEEITTQFTLTIAAIGMCVESLCFFLYMFYKTSLLLKLVVAFVPGLFTTLLYKVLLQLSWSYGLFLGFVTTFCYQNTYIRVMRGFPGSFSLGEAAVLVQGLMLFLFNTMLKVPNIVNATKVRSDFEQLNVIMMCALSYLFAVCWLLAVANVFRMKIYFYILMLLLAIGVTCTPITKPIPIIALLKFIRKDEVRIKIIMFYVALVALTVVIVWWRTQSQGKASTRVRKLFHLLIVIVYVPGLLYQCDFLYIASGVALALITFFELVRICNIPPLDVHLRNAFASFSDEKDAGVFALTPFCLLIGCSLPLWISPCPCYQDNTSSYTNRIVPLFSGILTIGFGDTAASVIGSKFGRIKWSNSKKSLEGTLAFVLATLSSILCLNCFGFTNLTLFKSFVIAVATIATALVEANTDQIDNLTLPIIFYTIVNII
ncbi:dolichol kinase-like isoform X2 [Eurosta solidaginis]|uniref:dolichol kinase-like isoform X2 n=1 Tax=Eurosta solidaginis TaxID=178769 RepID=UPI0035311D1B